MAVFRATGTLFVCLAAAGPALAQDPTGTLEGQVTDRNSGPIAAAHVSARNLDTGLSKETLTASGGLFRQPVANLNSPNFGRIFTAAPPRRMQFALKLVF